MESEHDILVIGGGGDRDLLGILSGFKRVQSYTH